MSTKASYIFIFAVIFILSACTTTLEPGEQLYTGLKKIKYDSNDNDSEEHFIFTREEIDAALAAAPNGALFGSSYYRTPFPYGLWIYNAFHDSKGPIAKWLNGAFGNEPVLLSKINPELRTSVAESVLQNHGYLRGSVDYDIIYGKPQPSKNDSLILPRTAKIQYNVHQGTLFTLDSIGYTNFPDIVKEVTFTDNSLLKQGGAFDVATLDEERTRLYNLFRDHGYYYYDKSYVSFLADTISVPDKVQLRVHLADSLPDEAMQKWIIGKTDIRIANQANEPLRDSIQHRFFTIHFAGKRSPLRSRIVLQDMQLRTGELFSQSKYEESLNRMVSKGIYSSLNISFKPRLAPDGTYVLVSDSVKETADGESRAGAGILDMTVNCVLEKPYDVSFQANYLGKTSGRMGPGIGIGLTKNNAFRGGELLAFNLAANYEFQTGGEQTSANSYEIMGDLSLTMPRLLLPTLLKNRRHRWFTTPQTIISISRETINRSGFFRRHILSSELSYTFQPSRQSRHQFSPLVIEYDRLAEMSDSYFKQIQESAVMMASLDDYFLTKMRYQYAYSSPGNYLNPIFWKLSVTESSNILALGYMAFGKKWNDKGKKAFKTPFAQFVKFETEFKKTWRIGDYSSLITHIDAGLIMPYGNSDSAPFSEYFYIGGANSLRGFSARSIGPGRYRNSDSKYSYITNIGNTKFVFNLEYRPRIFGSLYGAIFVDAGNIWNWHNDIDVTTDYEGNNSDLTTDLTDKVFGDTSSGELKFNDFAKSIALNTGIGLRYDLDFFVLRIDWGIALHSPYPTSRKGYFNLENFGKAQCLNFAIGYPF